MKYILIIILIYITAFSTQAKEKSIPNVIIIYGDDIGLGDVGVYGSKLIPTPNIDKLAANGLVFTDGHSSSATCTPSRYSLLTGRHAFRDNVNILPPDAPLCIPTNILTLPKLFKQAGYNTGIIGKWHLGIGRKGVKNNYNKLLQPGPLELGFDHSYIFPATNDRVPCVYVDGHKVVNLDTSDPISVGKSFEEVNLPGQTLYPDGTKDRSAMTYYESSWYHNHSVINGIGRIGYMSGGKSALWNDEDMADVLIRKAKDYISTNKNKPFLLYFASQDIHVPRTPHKRFQGKTSLGYRGDAMVQFDWTTGEIMKTLRKYGLTENTIIILSSDNGPTFDDGYKDGTTVKSSSQEVDGGHDASGIWSGGKGQIYEAGTRVPFIVSWPDKIEPGVSDAMVNQIDILASFAELLNLKIPDNMACDSRNTLQTFLGKSDTGLSYMVEETRFRKALRYKNWKYIAAGKARNDKGAPAEAALFNLSDDPGERNNIIQKHPKIAKEMEKQLNMILTKEGMRFYTKNLSD